MNFWPLRGGGVYSEHYGNSLLIMAFVPSIFQAKTSFIDFAHVRSLFLGHDDIVLKHKSINQQKKSNALLKDKKP